MAFLFAKFEFDRYFYLQAWARFCSFPSPCYSLFLGSCVGASGS